MSTLKWTGKGLQLLGRLLAADEFEDWLLSEGKKFFTERFEIISFNWLFGKARSKKQLFQETLDSINSETFRIAMQGKLEKLPDIISSVGSQVKKNGPNELYEESSFKWIAVVPRVFVQQDYQIYLIKELSQAAELNKFQSFPEIYLGDRSIESEESFFKFVAEQGYYICNKGIILGTDSVFDWQFTEIRGHYYYGRSDISSYDLSKTKERKRLISDLEEANRKLKSRLGGLSIAEIINIGEKLVAR